MWRHSSSTEPLGPLSIHVIAPEKLGRGLAVSSRAPIGPGYLRRRPTCTDNPNLRGLGSIVLGDFPGGGRTWIHVVVSTWTDNSGNGSALNKLKSTRCPSSVVLMELSCFLKRMSAKAMVAAHGELRGGRTGEWRRTERPLGSIRRDLASLHREIWPTALDMGRWRPTPFSQSSREILRLEDTNRDGPSWKRRSG